MCTQSVTRSTNERKLDPSNLTQADINRLLGLVKWGVPHWCDPEDALGYALLAAVEGFDPAQKGSFPAFVLTVARRYAIDQLRRNKTNQNSVSLDADERYKYIVGLAGIKLDDNEIDPELIDAITATIYQTRWDQERLRRPSTKKLAVQILATLAESVTHDAGIGVSEFDNAECTARTDRFRYERKTREANRQVKEAMCKQFDADVICYSKARTLLRKATARTIRERGIY